MAGMIAPLVGLEDGGMKLVVTGLAGEDIALRPGQHRAAL